MNNVAKHCINTEDSVRVALARLNDIAPDSILFVVDNHNLLIGSLTDGDLRRGFINNLGFEDSLLEFIQKNPISIIILSYFKSIKKMITKSFPSLIKKDVLLTYSILETKEQSSP